MKPQQRPLTGPTTVDSVRKQIADVFPQTDRYVALDTPATQVDEWQRITDGDVGAIGRIFWHMTQLMLVKDAAPLYLALAQSLGLVTISPERLAGRWMYGAMDRKLGEAVLCAVWDHERRFGANK